MHSSLTEKSGGGVGRVSIRIHNDASRLTNIMLFQQLGQQQQQQLAKKAFKPLYYFEFHVRASREVRKGIGMERERAKKGRKKKKSSHFLSSPSIALCAFACYAFACSEDLNIFSNSFAKLSVLKNFE